MSLKGKIISLTGGLYEVKVDKEIYKVKASGKLRYLETSPIVGDFVEFTPDEFIVKILPRKNSLIRPKVANIDQAVIVTSLKDPNYSSILLNKFLAIIEHNEIKPVILFTKRDLTDESHLEEYLNQGYEAYEISNKDVSSVDVIKGIFKDKTTVFTGQTGAGKSSTINSIAKLDLATDEISKSLGRGKHTTRVVRIIEWNDGELVDTPGFSSLEFDLTKLQLSRAYHDFEKLSANCKFARSCIHNHEKDCGIKEAVKNKVISQRRYDDYIRLLEEAK